MATILGSRALELSAATPRTIQVDLPNNLNLNANSIINGTLSADRIATGSITTSKLNVSTLSAITANLGSVTAGNITGLANIDITGIAKFSGQSGTIGDYYTGIFNDGLSTTGGLKAYAGIIGVAVYGDAGTTGDRGVAGVARSSSGTGVQAVNTSTGVALAVQGSMTKTGTELVTNLNAQLHGGKPVDQLCSIIVTNNGTATVGGNGFVLTSTVAGTRVSAPSGNSVVIESTSDRRLKQDIYPEKLGLDFINSLLPVEYKLKSNTDLKYHGFIADDIEKLISEDDRDSLFQVHSDGIKGSDYMSLIAPIVKSIQELAEQIKEIKERLNNG